METIEQRKTQMVDVEWREGLHFDAHVQGHTIKLASGVDGYEGGMGPKRLMLAALAGCTAMDVASLLPKMRVPFTSMNVSATATVTEDHPKVYDTIHVVYEIGADPEFLPKIESAVEKSTTKYCGVNAMMEKAAVITHEIKLV